MHNRILVVILTNTHLKSAFLIKLRPYQSVKKLVIKMEIPLRPQTEKSEWHSQR